MNRAWRCGSTARSISFFSDSDMSIRAGGMRRFLPQISPRVDFDARRQLPSEDSARGRAEDGAEGLLSVVLSTHAARPGGGAEKDAVIVTVDSNESNSREAVPYRPAPLPVLPWTFRETGRCARQA